MYNVKVYVTYKESILDPQGEAVRGAVHRMGFDEIEDIRIGKYFEIKVSDTADRSVEEVKCNSAPLLPVVQKHTPHLCRARTPQISTCIT